MLEQAARLLYKEWFVHLRFPDHEHVKIKAGVPDGWSFKCLGELATKIGSGSTPRGGAASYENEGITLIRSLNVYDYQFDGSGLAFINEDQAKKLSNVVVEPNDILLNITGASVGRCCILLSTPYLGFHKKFLPVTNQKVKSYKILIYKHNKKSRLCVCLLIHFPHGITQTKWGHHEVHHTRGSDVFGSRPFTHRKGLCKKDQTC